MYNVRMKIISARRLHRLLQDCRGIATSCTVDDMYNVRMKIILSRRLHRLLQDCRGIAFFYGYFITFYSSCVVYCVCLVQCANTDDVIP